VLGIGFDSKMSSQLVSSTQEHLFLRKASFGMSVFAGMGDYYPGPSPNPRQSPEAHLVLEFWAE
jgi:hypothetical protein